MKWGILGSGLRAEEIARQIISNGHELVCIASRSERRANEMAGAFNAKAQTYQEILSQSDLDAIYVACETSEHFATVRQAILAGHKVFCAKPICCSEDDYDELLSLNGFLVQDLWINWHPLIAKLTSTLKRAHLGKLECLRANYHSNIQPGYDDWRLNSQNKCGGVFWDLMIYLVAVVMKITERPITACDVHFQMNEKGSPNLVDLVLIFNEMQKAYLTVSTLIAANQPLVASCSEGIAILGGSSMNPVKLTLQALNGNTRVIERESENPARFSYLSFLRLLSSESELNLHRIETNLLMSTMFRIQKQMIVQ